MKQAEGSIQDLYGQAVDAAEDTIDAVRKMPADIPPLTALGFATGDVSEARARSAISLGIGLRLSARRSTLSLHVADIWPSSGVGFEMLAQISELLFVTYEFQVAVHQAILRKRR
jgi:hypothetical protein